MPLLDEIQKHCEGHVAVHSDWIDVDDAPDGPTPNQFFRRGSRRAIFGSITNSEIARASDTPSEVRGRNCTPKHHDVNDHAGRAGTRSRHPLPDSFVPVLVRETAAGGV